MLAILCMPVCPFELCIFVFVWILNPNGTAVYPNNHRSENEVILVALLLQHQDLDMICALILTSRLVPRVEICGTKVDLVIACDAVCLEYSGIKT
jgi:hypothetical protein